VIDHIKPNDSLLSIALAVQGRGYNAQKFMDAMRNQKNQDKLNTRQSREYEIPVNIAPSLGDKYLFAISGLDKLVELQ
jgi:hypothetical protein